MKAVFDVSGMHCQSCEQKLRESLLASPHVDRAEVSLADETATVAGDADLSLEELNDRVAQAGDYHLAPTDSAERQPAPHSDYLVEGVEHDADNNRFVYLSDSRESVLSYERPDAGVINLAHTFVPPADRGNGIAARLAESALNYAEQQTLRVIPTCSYVRSYLEDNPRYQSLTNGKKQQADDHEGEPSDASQHNHHSDASHDHDHADHHRSWLATYKPLLLIIGYLIGGTAIAGAAAGVWSAGFLMSVFMGLFFVAFSFFKMLDLAGFAEAYTSYDLIAARWLPYAYVYPFIELGLGVAYLLQVWPVAVNAATLAVMLVSTAGVVNAVARGRDIQCGCLGTMFDLPMSTLTIVEDGTMAVMAAVMLVMLLA
ncbi:Heavy-metal-associated domain protein [Posidoniimonas corsicana]|uniref:Heavy-metal-associated domain protein n=1 Tax=Posidoniimonas corsicana TaxID=1938618 RepID=A0A5C5UZK4_9BACT|nr:N-acetyltransferase [Posidoniimonas corsicana]TWT31050.1 Heavy-metal-associated domain protein [Posidoniimonas corsicana]